MSKAEEIRYKAVMAADNQEPPKDYAISAYADHFNGFVEGYIEGYHQAEKDLELTWEDIKQICDITFEEACRLQRNMRGSCIYKEPHYQEVLKQFKEQRT